MTKMIVLIAVGAFIGGCVPHLVVLGLQTCCGWAAP